jgi:hypothetical protein
MTVTKLFYICYGIYNLALSIIVLWILLYLEMYINDLFIPFSRWAMHGNISLIYLISSFIIVLTESSILFLLVYFINKRYLLNVVKTNKSKTIAIFTLILFWITLASLFFHDHFIG